MPKYKVGDYLGSNKILFKREVYKENTNERQGIFDCPECGKEFQANPSRVEKNKVSTCYKCAVKKREKYKPGDFVGKHHNIKIVDRYTNKNGDKRFLLCCPVCGKTNWDVDVTSLLKVDRCYECYKKERVHQLRDTKKYNNGDFIGSFKTLLVQRSNLPKEIEPHPTGLFKCSVCGRLFSARIDHVASNFITSCGQCSSKWNSEYYISIVLDELGIDYIRQYSFDDCVNPKTGYKLYFDYFIPSLNICIEYDGRQHFEPIDYFGGEQSFVDTQYRDNIKNEYCKSHNILLIRYSYKQALNEIKSLLTKEMVTYRNRYSR